MSFRVLFLGGEIKKKKNWTNICQRGMFAITGFMGLIYILYIYIYIYNNLTLSYCDDPLKKR
jgi:hypothetical protein